MINNLVSIIIPTFGRPDTLSNAIDSCLGQTYKPIEIIVVDDNDPNSKGRKETEKVMSEYVNHYRIKYIQHEYNKNGSAARNTGFKNSQGEFIAFLDDDDYFYPTKIENQIKRFFELTDDYGVCYSKYETRKNGLVTLTYKDNVEGSLLEYALMRNLFIAAGSNLLVKRHVIEEINGFDESFSRNQDLEFLVRILQIYKIAYDDNLGLIVNAATSPRNVDFIDITNQFRKRFDYFINKLPASSIKKIDKVINLQIFRYYLINKKNIKLAFGHCHKSNIGAIEIIRYLLYLGKRVIRKSSESYYVNLEK